MPKKDIAQQLRDIVRKGHEVSSPGYYDEELIDKWKFYYPKGEKSFQNFVRELSGKPEAQTRFTRPLGGRHPAESRTDFFRDFKKSIGEKISDQDIADIQAYESLPPNEQARQNVQSLERLRKLGKKAEEDQRKYAESVLNYDFDLTKLKKEKPEEYKSKKPLSISYDDKGNVVYDMPTLNVYGEVDRIGPPNLLGAGIRRPLPQIEIENKYPVTPTQPKGPPPTRKAAPSMPTKRKSIPWKFDVFEDFGGSLGKGLAAFGDAFALAGGAKTNFLDSIFKGEKYRDQLPFKKFQSFAKLLNTEVNQKLLNEYRTQRTSLAEKTLENTKDFQKKTLAGRTQTRLDRIVNDRFSRNMQTKKNAREEKEFIQKQLWKKKGSILVKDEADNILLDKGHNIYPKWLHDRVLSDREAFEKSFNMNQLKKLSDGHVGLEGKLKLTDAKKLSPESILSPYNDAFSTEVLRSIFKGKIPEGTPRSDFHKHLSSDDLKNIKPIMEYEKKRSQGYFTSQKRPKWQKYARSVVETQKDIFKAIAMAAGVGSLERDQIEVSVDGRIWFTPKDGYGRLRGDKRREVDLPGFAIPGREGVHQVTPSVAAYFQNKLGITNPQAGIASYLEQKYEQIYAPKRREDFGASQSFLELQRYDKGIGKTANPWQRQGQMLDYILKIGDAAKKDLDTYYMQGKDLPGAKYWLDRDLFDHEEIGRPSYVDKKTAFDMGWKAYHDNKAEVDGGNLEKMPSFYRDVIDNLKINFESNRLPFHFLYERKSWGEPQKYLGANQFYKESLGGLAEPAFKKGPGGQLQNNWTPEVWLKFIQQKGLDPKGWR